jgi:predicted Ser/Thr protein kinase
MMNRDRWEQLKPLFQGALEQPASQRAAWLRRACPDDAALREEALSLIQSHETAGDFLEQPASIQDDLSPEIGSQDGENGGFKLQKEPGSGGFRPQAEQDAPRQIGPYVIRGELGRGGMGVVYLAEDVRLGRTVALKALPALMAGDRERRERLRREARAAAALTHPGIAVVYALEEFEGDLFMAAEHVRGRSLRAELHEGPLDPARALDTMIEIVRALCAAHENGIVHRDLKPENILRTEDGRIKILDFGIAQFTDETLTQLTRAGAVMGTPAYMAPEQLVGPDVDFRADLYAAGVILVEMVTGRHPFATGERPRAPMPDGLKAIADRCLARDPRERYGSTRELLAALEAVRRTDVGAGPAGGPTAQTGPAATFTPRWWWEFHQAVAALVYWLMAIPVWHARGLIGGVTGRAIFLVTLAAIIVAANLRLHLWFTSRFYPSELTWVRGRNARWVNAADWVFSLALVAAGLVVGDESAALATLLISFGIGAAVVFLVVEPVTEKAAFRS